MTIWLSRERLENATSVAMVAACLSENDVFNDSALCDIIERAEVEVLSYLAAEYGPTPYDAATIAKFAVDPFLRYAALDFAVAFMFDRHPEYVRANTSDTSEKRMTGAIGRMKRVQTAEQRPTKLEEPPANVGGFSVGSTANLYIDSPGGPPGGNAGDY